MQVNRLSNWNYVIPYKFFPLIFFISLQYNPWTTFKSEPHFSAQCSCDADNSSFLDILSSLGIYVCLNREQQFWLAIPGLCDHFKYKLCLDLSSVFPCNKFPAFIGFLTCRFPKGKGGDWLNKAFSIITVCRRLWAEIAIPGQCSTDFMALSIIAFMPRAGGLGAAGSYTLDCIIKRWMCIIYDRNGMPRTWRKLSVFMEILHWRQF